MCAKPHVYCSHAFLPAHPVVRTIVCCIYHKPRRFDESSSESESASESASDAESDKGGRYGDDRARPMRRCRHSSHGHGCGHNAVRRDGQGGAVHEPDSDSDVNAYEREPRRKC
ncbi:hypothetical protein JVT61DRAFT_4583 [Boletus reticuloceps]|uniref:Uncharacterized protein n=1 Tax=Boletus reticuloceps TaxID=495285 RepID=A0A8I2YMD7_9AGAM|nr:hypothetical protein JVT61DRAFT_4583 [Boletus reticuloceps]